MNWIEKRSNLLSFLCAIVSIVVSIFAFMKANTAEDRARSVEFFSIAKDVANSLNLEFNAGALSFNTLDSIKDETTEQRRARFRDAGIGIKALESIADNENEKDGVIFFKMALLLQQREYGKIDQLIKDVGGKCDRLGFIASTIYTDYRSGYIENPHQIVKGFLTDDPNNFAGNLIYALLLKDKGDYEKSIKHLNLLGSVVNENPSLLSLKNELIELTNQ
ncbi:hypothetical protein [Comamonas jiangduensis]|uniref:Tetratricopeptide repeat protein n=1 Tax=Comamonas jiangduensis TaxID=1194168 RepID=A0ABV4IEB6_9BURK